jgi:serine protease Do
VGHGQGELKERTLGHVRRRPIPFPVRFPYDDFIQIDAPVNKGNSGGPAFDEKGNVVGVTTAIYSPSAGSVGIGFVIAAKTVESVVTQLKDHGTVMRGWIGVQIQTVTNDIADSRGLKNTKGALVAEPQAGGPAAAGLVISSSSSEALSPVGSRRRRGHRRPGSPVSERSPHSAIS